MPKVSRPKLKKIVTNASFANWKTRDFQIGTTAFDHQSRTRMVFGVNCVERVGELARLLGAKKILLVTDPGIVAAGHAGRVQHILADAKLRVTLYGKARENPTTTD